MSERTEVSKTAQEPARNGASLMPPVDVLEDADAREGALHGDPTPMFLSIGTIGDSK